MRLSVFAVLLLLFPLVSMPVDSTQARAADAIGRQSIPPAPSYLAAHSTPGVVAILPDSDGRAPAHRAYSASGSPAGHTVAVVSSFLRESRGVDRLPPRLCERLPYDATAPPSIG